MASTASSSSMELAESSSVEFIDKIVIQSFLSVILDYDKSPWFGMNWIVRVILFIAENLWKGTQGAEFLPIIMSTTVC